MGYFFLFFSELNNIMVSKSLILFIMHMLVDKGMSIEIIRSSPDEITGTTGICSSFNAVWMPFGCKCGLFQAETFFSDNGQHAACQNQASLGERSKFMQIKTLHNKLVTKSLISFIQDSPCVSIKHEKS